MAPLETTSSPASLPQDAPTAPSGRNPSVGIFVGLLHSLTGKLLLVLLLTILGSTTFIFWTFEKNYQQDQVAQLHTRLNNFISLQRTALAGPMWSLDLTAINTLIRGYATDPDLDAAALYNEHDKLLTSTGPMEALATSNPLRTEMPITFTHGGKEDYLGRLVIGFHDRRLAAEQSRRFRNELLTLLVLLLVITSAVVLTTRHIISLPLRRLLASLEHASDTTIRIREPVRWESSDELGAVVKAYNLLLAREATAEAKVQDYQEHLEELVVRRTKELDEARQSAVEANRAKGDFLANMSHEIRTPMNAIIGLSHLALKMPLEERLADYVEKIHGSARALLGIINDILDFSKIEAGKLTMEEIPFQLDDVVRNLSEIVSLKAAEKDLELLIAIDPKVPNDLTGDPLRLHQVLLNLCTNAVKFTPRGEVRVSCTQFDVTADGRVGLHFSVADTGIGLSQTQMEQLFRPFSQADSSTTRRYGGTGLGLAICKQIVEMLDGTIGVNSTIGTGSTFWFTSYFGIGTATATQIMPEVSFFAALRVLIVDDNLFARNALTNILSSLGCQAEGLESGEEAVKLVAREANTQPFDLLFIDWLMPGMDGIETAERIQALALPSPPQMIMVSGYDRDELSGKIRSLGLHSLLLKPISHSTLVDTLLHIYGQAAHPASATQLPSTEIQFPPGIHVLLVEDNDLNQMVAREVLERAGIEVTIATNGQEGVDAILACRFDAVLMDVQMPILDGYAATRQIRAQEKYRTLPIIAMTANTMSGDRERAIQAGMNDHIGKPFDIDDLLAVLQRWTVKRVLPPLDLSPPPSPPLAPENDIMDAALLELSRVDFAAGLKNVGGNEVLYKKILVAFCHGQTNFAQNYEAACQDSDASAPLRMAHTLKGVAASVGARGISKLAAELEAALGPDGAQENIEPCVTRLSRALAQTITNIEAHKGVLCD